MSWRRWSVSRAFFSRIISIVTLAVSLAIERNIYGISPRHPNEEFASLIDRVHASRETLVTGSYIAKGQIVDNGKWGDFTGSISVYSAFDFSAALFRYDIEEDHMVYDRLEKPEHAKTNRSWKAKKRGGKVVITSAGELLVRNGIPVIEKLASGSVRDSSLRPMDVRVVGLLQWDGLDSFPSLADVIEEWHELRGEITINTAEQTTRVTVEWPEYWAELVVNEDLFSSPEKFSVFVREGNGSRRTFYSEVQWLERDGTAVPLSYLMELTPSENRLSRREIEYEWQSVNVPLASDVFTEIGLSESSPLYLVNSRLDKPFVEGIAGLQTTTGAIPVRRSQIWLVLGNAVIVVALVVWFVFVRHRKHSRKM